MFGGISVWQLLILLVVIILIFGTKKLRTVGGDLGGAVKGFKKAMNDDGLNLDKSDSIEVKGNKPGEIEGQQQDAKFSESVMEQKITNS